MNASPLIAGFKRGLTGQSSPPPAPRPTIRELAGRYAVTPRTIFRWQAAGVDLADRLAIASHIASNARSGAALDAAMQSLNL